MKRSTALLFVVVLLAAVVGASLVSPGCGGTTGYTVSEGRLEMGSPTDVIPFEAVEGGKPTGFDVEMVQEIAKRLGLTYKFTATPWDSLIPDLKSGKYDVLAAAMTITYARQKEIDFSDPYFTTDQSIVVKVGSPIKSGTDLTGKVVGVLNESTPQAAAEHIKVIKEIKKYPTVAEVYAALEKGEVDAMIMDLSIAKYRSKTEGKTSVVAEIATGEQYGIAVRKGNATLLKKVNEALKNMKSDGTYDRIYAKWFGQSK